MKVIFWGKYIDNYLIETLLRFGEIAGEPVHYVLVEEGFTRRNVTNRNLDDQSDKQTILAKHSFFDHANRILEENEDAIHIFLSFWGDKRLFRVLLGALRRGKQVAVIYEPYAAVPHGYWKDEGWLISHLKVWGRRVAYRALWPLIRLSSRGELPCVLAVSPQAEEQLRRVGFETDVIYPFGYFIERKAVEPAQKEKPDVLRVAFSGLLIKRKGLDVAIAAVREVNAAGVRVQLDIFGPGEITKFLVQEIPGIRYWGTYPQAEAQQVLSGYDLLLVPSRHEGWGLVVNEALLQGVPVLASDRVGAGCLLERSGSGRIFKSGDVAQLGKLLTDIAADRTLLKEMAAACAVAGKHITPSIGADYLKNVLDYHFNEAGSRPEAVWLTYSVR